MSMLFMRRKKPALLLHILFFMVTSGSAQPISWYKCLSGTIDKHPVTLHLHKAGNEYSGYYYYNSKEQPVFFTGEDTSQRGVIQLMVYPNNGDEGYEIFSITFSGNTCSGSWKKDAGSKALKFSAAEINPSPDAVFDYVFTKGSVTLFPKWKESPTAEYDAASVWPKNNAAGAAWLKEVIGKNLGAKNFKEDIGKYLLTEKKSYLNSYMDDHKKITKDEIGDYPQSYTNAYSGRLNIIYSSSKILSLANYTYEYIGGAHGNHGTSYSSYNIASHKIITLQDVLTPAGIKMLPALLEKNIRKQYRIKETEKLSETLLFGDTIEPNDNFFVTGKGIVFGYNPYEIAAYAAGEILVFIPFTDMVSGLQLSFKELIR